ncbi:MAG: radical SAM family heme chaperone HemW [Deltaproteobacteria bacterium]|nr:radical SAM family heme chaperone HemW [Deltaproteobacteria bacterium]
MDSKKTFCKNKSEIRNDQLSTLNSPLSTLFGIYIHVPFCVWKCSYCSFYSVAGHNKWFDQYVSAVHAQIKQAAQSRWSRGRQVESIFFGGGTPTVLDPEQLVFLLQQCGLRFDCQHQEIETSIEVNPATIDLDGLVRLRRGGFNRISIGVQSLHDRELKCLGRLHTADDALHTVAMAREAGFVDLSMDLMYGLPGQDVTAWQQTLDQALAVAPDHLSIYELTLEQGTPFFARAGQGELDLPDEDEVLAMLDHTCRIMERADFQRYEISNYARPGHECRHNVNYWNNGSYLGFGPGAVTCKSGRRMKALADVEQFCKCMQSGQPVCVDEEELSPEERFRETVIMGLRMTCGISLNALEKRFAINLITYYGATLDQLMRQQLLEVHQGRLRLTERGLLLANTVMAELV